MITVATELSELANLFGFRYRIYAEEMSRKQKYSNLLRSKSATLSIISL